MKQFYSFVPVLIFSAGITIFLAITPSQPYKAKNVRTTYSSHDIEGAADFINYELERLRDPETGKIPDNIRQKELDYASLLPGSVYPEFL